jgi:hypothetical protein
MEQGFLPIFFGAIIGAMVSFLTMVAFVFWKKQSVNKSQVSKESIMHSIGELCAEIDSLIASNKEGIVNNSGIQNALRKKHDEIIRLLKPNMHILDVYFVKYIDCVQKEYLKLLSGTPVDTIQSPASSKSIAFTVENKVEGNKSVENNSDKSGNSSSRTGSVEHDLHALESAFFKEPGKLANKKSPDPILPESNGSAEEVMLENAAGEKEFMLLSDKKTDEKNETPVKEAATSNCADEEEFTMETIMDLDIGKLARASGLGDTPLSQRSLKKHDPFKPTSKDSSSSPLKTFLSTKKSEPLFESQSDKSKETLLSAIKSKPEVATQKLPSEALANVEKKSSTTVTEHPAAVHDDKKDIEITGDDVASKIDAFFGIDKE